MTSLLVGIAGLQSCPPCYELPRVNVHGDATWSPNSYHRALVARNHGPRFGGLSAATDNESDAKIKGQIQTAQLMTVISWYSWLSQSDANLPSDVRRNSSWKQWDCVYVAAVQRGSSAESCAQVAVQDYSEEEHMGFIERAMNVPGPCECSLNDYQGEASHETGNQCRRQSSLHDCTASAISTGTLGRHRERRGYQRHHGSV